MSGKQIIAFIPTQCKSNQWKALTYLNGYEITSVNPKKTFYTPYEVQVVLKSVSTQGLTLLISTTSATQIHSLFVSYIAYDPSIQNLAAQNVVYDKYAGVKQYQHVATNSNSMHLMFCGISSFIVSNTGATFGLSISMNDQGSIAHSASNFYYLSWGEFTLTGGKCGQCVGYSIYHDGKCVASCPPSSYFDGQGCVTCQTGEVWDGSKCVPKPVDPVGPVGPVNPVGPVGPVITCPAGTYWDQQQLRCLPCKAGCATCVDCYSCSTCSLGFYFKQGNPLCDEVCGDGLKFVSDCDDGNNINGDGCSSTCEVETGYYCSGGSPQGKDTCSQGLPNAITLKSTGQSFHRGSVIVNVKLNYLPRALLDSAVDCKNKCDKILSAQIISGDKSASSIIAHYIPNSRYTFSVEVHFGARPFGMFVLEVGIRPTIASKYFSNMDASATTRINVNPSYFSRAGSNDVLN